MKNLFTSALLGLVIMLSSQLAKADTIVSYEFTGAARNQATVVATANLANTTASEFSRGNGLTPGGSTSVRDYLSAASFTSSTGADAMAAGDYFTFTVSASSGKALNLTQLDFAVGRTSSTGPTTWNVRSSFDNYATDLGTNVTTTTDLNNPDTSKAFSAGSSVFNFTNISTPVTFRIYGLSGAGTGSGSIDNVRLTGTLTAAVSTPEPATWAMMILGVCALSIFQIRRKRAAGMIADSKVPI